ncbi:Fibrous sheath-interacting protein 2-like [Oopsacas minuta]|uniref:Fibrous sheath-interacting protein 2-like n=1 Tax=Oopsacas minuta TaxID=111878 RepID=A0AAV7K7P6_9METZ|nr:Fibrous sheath-interacting protein 2-like [Oopsacas minuta]
MDQPLDQNKTIPSLPKIYQPTQELVTTHLGEPYYARHDYHVFETTRPKNIPLNFEYNSLHDPNLRYYFNRPHMLDRLQKLELINENRNVICSMKFHHIFRDAMEYEARKLRDKQYDEERRNGKEAAPKNPSKIDERINKVKQFKQKQEKAQQYLRNKIQKQSEYDQKEVDRRRQEAAKEKQRREIEREAERERKLTLMIEREQQLLVGRRKMVSSRDHEEQKRATSIRQHKEQRVLHHHDVIAQRFRRWDEHHGKIMDEQASRKRQIDEEKRRNRAKREKIFRILQNRQEATHQKLLEKNHDEVEQLYIEANAREQEWIEKRSRAIHEWKKHQEHMLHGTPPHVLTPPTMGCLNTPTAPNIAKQMGEQEVVEYVIKQEKQKRESIKQTALAHRRVTCTKKVQGTFSTVLAERAIRSAIDIYQSNV